MALALGLSFGDVPRADHVQVLRLIGDTPSEQGAAAAPADATPREVAPGQRGDRCCAEPMHSAAEVSDAAPAAASASAFQDATEMSPVREQDAEPQTAPPAAPEIEEERDPYSLFVHVDAEDTSRPSPDTERIAAYDSHADHETRTPVTTDRDGPLTPRILGPEDASASPTLERHDGHQTAASGNRAVEAPIDENPVSGGGGGGGGGHAAGKGSRSGHGDRLPGGQVARSGGGAGQPIAASESAGLPNASVYPEGIRPDDNARGPDWWQPSAFRMTMSAPSTTASGQDSDLASPTSGDGVALVEAVGDRGDRGGTNAVETEDYALPGLAERDAGPTEGRDLGSADPVEELRIALGWGGIDRDRLSPRPEWAGTLAGKGASHTSPQTALDEVAISWRTAVNARGTAVGQYISQVEDIVGARWQRQDIDTSSRAVGIQGQVTVQYSIRPTGRVTDIHLTRSSGNRTLDQIAVDAIPRKLPRFPPGIEREAIRHRIVLRYRNPLVGTSAFLP